VVAGGAGTWPQGRPEVRLTKAQVRLAQAAMKNRDTWVGELCQELGGITRATLYRYVSPECELREHGMRVLGSLSRVENTHNPKSSLHENDATLNPTLIYSSKKSMRT
jgi:hypothetical protein